MESTQLKTTAFQKRDENFRFNGYITHPENHNPAKMQ